MKEKTYSRAIHVTMINARFKRDFGWFERIPIHKKITNCHHLRLLKAKKHFILF